MRERQPRRSRPARPPEARSAGPEARLGRLQHFQTSFLAPEDATLYAELQRLRYLISELHERYGRRLQGREGEPDVVIRHPKDVADLLMPEMQELGHEEFRTVLVNSKNVVLDVETIYKGTLNSAPIRIAEVFRPAILAKAASLIAVHNHPSGAPRSAWVESSTAEPGKECSEWLRAQACRPEADARLKLPGQRGGRPPYGPTACQPECRHGHARNCRPKRRRLNHPLTVGRGWSHQYPGSVGRVSL
jgi:hypothetical protein